MTFSLKSLKKVWVVGTWIGMYRGRSGGLPGTAVTFVVSALRKLKQEN